ncbi:MAG: ribosome silencing factor [Burkholderiales bacterium]
MFKTIVFTRRAVLNQTLSDIAIDALEQIKALDIVTIDITASNALFDQIIVASAESTRQARAFVNNLKENLKGTGHGVLSVEGETSGEWVLVDLGDLIVHVMKPEVRTYYNLEDLWQETPSSEKGDHQQVS